MVREEAAIYNLPGKYYTHNFKKFASGSYAQEAIFQVITSYTNTYDLDIKVVGKIEEGITREGIPIIFEKRN